MAKFPVDVHTIVANPYWASVRGDKEIPVPASLMVTPDDTMFMALAELLKMVTVWPAVKTDGTVTADETITRRPASVACKVVFVLVGRAI
jgi:hypothetical protein